MHNGRSAFSESLSMTKISGDTSLTHESYRWRVSRNKMAEVYDTSWYLAISCVLDLYIAKSRDCPRLNI